MNRNPKCPTIGQYLEALNDPYGLFRTLGEVIPERDAGRQPQFLSGNYSAVFRVRLSDGRCCALKCYTRLPGYPNLISDALSSMQSPYLVPFRYLPDELFVPVGDGGVYWPVTLIDWVEGEPLGRCLIRLCGTDDRAGLRTLARRFDRMALWLLEADFAHGDLKQDNLIVMENGRLRLIDYDGVFLPSLADRPGLVAASPAYRDPSRDVHYYGPEVDSYPAALISFSLHALSLDPSLLSGYSDGENIILDAAEVQPGRSELYERLMERFGRDGRTALVQLGRLLRRVRLSRREVREALRGLSDDRAASVQPMDVIDDEDPCMAVFSRGGLFGYADLVRGKVRLEPVYQDAGPFREDMAVVRLNGKLGMIDRDGALRLDCGAYDYVGPLGDGRALIRREGLFGFIDRRGREVVPPQYPFAGGFHEGLAVVRIGDKYGYVDPDGCQVIPPVFDRAYRFAHGKARVCRRGETFFIDKSDEKWQVSVKSRYL